MFQFAFAQGSVPCSANGAPGWWSRQATDLCASVSGTPAHFVRNIRIDSPDRTKTLHFVNEHWWIQMGSKRLRLPENESYLEYPAEASWAPDSDAFYITWSNGSIEGFRTEIYVTDRNSITHLPGVNAVVWHDFNRKHKCVSSLGGEQGIEPNVGGLTWVGGSRQLLLVAEVPPEGMCGQMGYFGGYLISAHGGQVLQRYSPENLFQQFGKIMGKRLHGDFSGLTRKEKSELP